MTKIRKEKALLEKAIKGLPKNVELFYLDRNDSLSKEQLARCLGGQVDEVSNEIQDNLMDNSDFSIDYLLADALPDEEEREALKESDSYLEFRVDCQDKDTSTPFSDILGNTQRHMVRVKIGDTQMDSDSCRWDEKKIEQEARKLARAAKIVFTKNRSALIQIVENASYGGELFILFYARMKDLIEPINKHVLVDPEKNRVRLTFTDPCLLLLDRINGSGHDHDIKGKVVVEFGMKDLDPRSGVMQLDHRGANTGYSWSDDIADVVYSAYENEPKIELI